jgi:hypothetical protein
VRDKADSEHGFKNCMKVDKDKDRRLPIAVSKANGARELWIALLS